jgi:hypothetical protein
MHNLIKILNLKKFKKNFIFFELVNIIVLLKKKNIFLLNYQNGMNFYFYNGLKLKSSGSLLNKKIILSRKKDSTTICFLLYSPLIIYFF